MSEISIDNLDAYLRDPLGVDAPEVSKLTSEAADPGNEDEKHSGESSGAAAETSQEPQDTAPEAKADEPEPDKEPENAVIKTKDGKHEIPYAVLQRERERAKQLESQLAELNAKLANAAEAKETGTADLTRSVDEIISPDELAALKEDAPKLGEVFEKLIGKISTLEQSNQRFERSEQDRVAESVQAAIDANPKLSYVQATDQTAFNSIAEIDTWMRGQAQFKGLNLEDRFAKAVSMYEAAHGAIVLPDSASGKSEQTTDEAKAKAEAAIEKAMAKAGPNTLTDIPGGQPPASNDIEAAQQMSAAELTRRFMDMTPDKMQEYLAKFG